MATVQHGQPASQDGTPLPQLEMRVPNGADDGDVVYEGERSREGQYHGRGRSAPRIRQPTRTERIPYATTATRPKEFATTGSSSTVATTVKGNSRLETGTSTTASTTAASVTGPGRTYPVKPIPGHLCVRPGSCVPSAAGVRRTLRFWPRYAQRCQDVCAQVHICAESREI